MISVIASEAKQSSSSQNWIASSQVLLAMRVARSSDSMSFITGVGLTSFGRHEGSSTLDLMSRAAELAIADAGLKRAEIDGVLCGYSTVQPHIMLATVFAEHFGIKPPTPTPCRSAAPRGWR